ncbi:MAG TPA: SurA N-terminal domain-containing protein [Gammaproteobacteria bacterium]|nr:SurA N-terminal domain-containing protein [Gammaproteobacteria bacterium]
MMQRGFFRYFLGLIGLCAAIHALAATSGAVPLDRVVAVVNDKVITESQLNAMLSDMKGAMQTSGTPIPPDIKKKALDQLINQQLQMQVATRNKIVADDAEVNKVIGQIAAQNHLTTPQLKDALAKQNVSFNKFRSQIHDQLVVHKLQQGLFAGRVTVSDAEAQAYMRKAPRQADANTQYHLEDLLIPLDESASSTDVAAAQKQAQDLLAKARQGTSFGQLSATSSGLEQSDLGWRRVNELPDVFAPQVTALKPGGISAPIRAPNGIHLIKLVELQGQAKPLTLDDAKNQVFQQKIKTQIDDWLNTLRKSAYIKIM